jgi:hypothetical protein
MVADFAEEKKQERAQREADAARTRRRKQLAVGVTTALCGSAWFLPLPQPQTNEVELPVAFVRASAGITLGLAARRLEEFRTSKGRLPRTLSEAQVMEPALIYGPRGDSGFVLRLAAGDTLLSYDSSRPAVAVSADAAVILKTTGR